jgi:ABC-type microcin C transport system permease subunit YejB
LSNAVLFNAVLFNAVLFNALLFNAVLFNAALFNAALFNAALFTSALFRVGGHGRDRRLVLVVLQRRYPLQFVTRGRPTPRLSRQAQPW